MQIILPLSYNLYLLCINRSLDLTGPLLLGGVPNLPENFPVINREFVGCMKELHIDNKRIDMAAYIANNGTFPGNGKGCVLLSLLCMHWHILFESLALMLSPCSHSLVYNCILSH